GAYMAEIVRAGILAVDHGQVDASMALGMSRGLAMRRIILPQAMRVIMPPAGNQFISLLKATSLVSVIAGGDLLTAAQNISSANLKTIELMLVATFWYLVLTTITSIGQYFVERRLARAGTGLRAR
ncbi:MAG TPA: amino acid ABC transporter permease, partial [Caldimonas sp.]|nr:amino acid ABC transporter permease [Caldimonas sp.]